MKVKCIKQDKIGNLEVGRIYELSQIENDLYEVIGSNCNIKCDNIKELNCDLFELIN